MRCIAKILKFRSNEFEVFSLLIDAKLSEQRLNIEFEIFKYEKDQKIFI